MGQIDLVEIKKQIASYPNWYHRIELAPGIMTPGVQNSGLILRTLDSLGLPADCKGLRVLDLGVRDGFFSFEMERRGAEVVAVDYAKPTATGFCIASEILQSKVCYNVDNIYSLTPEKYGTFDVILFLGLIYHLRNPMLALDTIRSLCRNDSLLLIESAIMNDPLAKFSIMLGRLFQMVFGKKYFPDVTTWRFLSTGSLNADGTNCWLPSMAGLKAAVEAAEFRMMSGREVVHRGLMAVQAVANTEISRFRKLDTSVGEY